MKRSFISVVAILFLSVSVLAEDVKIPWPGDKSAVAWQTRKRMFMVKSATPVGISTELNIEAMPDKLEAAAHVIKFSVPISSFNSGEPDRDKEVAKILKASVQPAIEFTADSLNQSELKDLVANKLTVVPGVLKIGGKSYPVEFKTHVTGEGPVQFITGRLETTFSAFEIEPPSVGGGMVAKVRDELVLTFRIFTKDVKGF